MLRFLLKHRLKVVYIPEVLVHMQTGGVSNASLRNRIRANRMDRKAWEVNGLRPYPFYLGIILSVAGFLCTFLLVKDTRKHVVAETATSDIPLLSRVFRDTTWFHPNLGSISQAGMVNNLNDGLVWGILPLLLASKGFSLEKIGFIVSIYPMVWGLGQALTGKMADHFNKKFMLTSGMLMQGLALAGLAFANNPAEFIGLSVILGIGTAIVYPTFLAAIADNTHPTQRAKSIGVFRLWRDLGYALGALLTGILADFFGIPFSILSIGLLTLLSGIIIWIRMRPSARRITRWLLWITLAELAAFLVVFAVFLLEQEA